MLQTVVCRREESFQKLGEKCMTIDKKLVRGSKIFTEVEVERLGLKKLGGKKEERKLIWMETAEDE